VSGASNRRIAGKESRLPAPASPGIGFSSTATDLPDPGYSTRPCVGALTSGVSSQKPGSAGLPSEAIVLPKSASFGVGFSAIATAAARSSLVVVSNCSTVRAAADGRGEGLITAGISAAKAGSVAGISAAFGVIPSWAHPLKATLKKIGKTTGTNRFFIRQRYDQRMPRAMPSRPLRRVCPRPRLAP
jgi:hypothetical protein